MALKINWDKFKVINEDYRKSFESLTYSLFCRKFRISGGIFRYKNQIGIETEPIKENGKLIGFQTKWFDTSIDKKKIIKSITNAKENNPKLNNIIFYINQEFSESSKRGTKESKTKEDIESHAEQRKIDIEWIVPSNFELILNKPSNLDLAQLYFEISDEFGFIKAYSNPDMLTFLQSSECIELPYINSKTGKLTNIAKNILEDKKIYFLISGHPGSGKSVSMHFLFKTFSGLDKKNVDKIREVLQKNKAVPMLINLKNCTFDTIENIIRNRQNDYDVRNRSLGFIYLLDGLDELTPEKADHVLSYLRELEQDQNTKKIIISCRSGNLNRVKAKTYFENITEYKIDNLNQDHIVRYFTGRDIDPKNKLLTNLTSKNPKLLAEIRDILLVKLLWDTIEDLNTNSVILDLLEKKVMLLIGDQKYRKNIEHLNLLDPKEDKIIELNMVISFEFQKKYQYQLSQEEIQSIILNEYPRIDFKSTNEILDYIATLFFDSNPHSLNEYNFNTTFAYQHRRYQDFFFIQHLKKVYEQNPKLLRELKILSNQDFLEYLFLNYLRKEYKKEKDLPGIIELNLIDVYLGNRNDYGVDNPYYQNSSEFIPSLATQNNIVLQELLADESLMIEDKISPDLNDLKSKFEAWSKDKNSWRLTEYLKSVWEEGMAFLLQNIVIFWRLNKQKVAYDLRNILSEIEVLYGKNNFHKHLEESNKADDPYWNNWEDYLYIKIVIDETPPLDVLKKQIRGNYKYFPDVREQWPYESGRERLMKSYLSVCIKNKRNILPQIIDALYKKELKLLLEVIISESNLPLVINNKTITRKLKTRIKNMKSKNIQLLFFKKLFSVKISKAEEKFIEESLKQLRDKRPIDWRMEKIHIGYATAAYILSQHSFEEYLKPQKGHSFRYYNELGLYAALFSDYITLLKNHKSIEAIVRDYIRYINYYNEDPFNRKYLKTDISTIWAYIFINSTARMQDLVNIKNTLITKENNISLFSFLFKIQDLSRSLFVRLVNKSELRDLENILDEWHDDFPSYVNHCFSLSILFAQIDSQKAISYIAKGINEGMIRHGWRKDIIVSYNLVEALGILWKNNWASKDDLIDFTKQVYDLTFHVTEITDGRETWQGPYNVIDLISKHDIEVAIELKNDLKEKEGETNFSNIAISSILFGKINMGLSFDEIEEGIKEYYKDYRFDGKPKPDYYEQRFIIYLAVAQSDFYTKDERKRAFESAYSQIVKIKEQEIDYFLRDNDFKEEKKSFLKLCKKYKKEANVSFDQEDKYRIKAKISETYFINEVNDAKTKQKIAGLYKKLNNHKNGIVLTNLDSWKLLIEKTYLLNHNIKLFVELIRKNSFPHTDFYTSNSRYFYLGLAVALNKINTKQEILDYLFDNSTGHGGFVNVMKAYAVNSDQEMCINLFNRYIRFCDFLVN